MENRLDHAGVDEGLRMLRPVACDGTLPRVSRRVYRFPEPFGDSELKLRIRAAAAWPVVSGGTCADTLVLGCHDLDCTSGVDEESVPAFLCLASPLCAPSLYTLIPKPIAEY